MNDHFHFSAYMYRLRSIKRWSLMRSTATECCRAFLPCRLADPPPLRNRQQPVRAQSEFGSRGDARPIP